MKNFLKFSLKKAESLSLTTVVVAAIVLLVLVILSVIFVGRMGRMTEKMNSCEDRGGSCYPISEGLKCSDHGASLIEHPDSKCLKIDSKGNKVQDPEKICCINNIR